MQALDTSPKSKFTTKNSLTINYYPASPMDSAGKARFCNEPFIQEVTVLMSSVYVYPSTDKAR